MANAGDMCEVGGEVKYEWKIKDFLLLPHESDELYTGPEFSYFGSTWKIGVCPNGYTGNDSEGWIGLYPFRVSCDVSVKLRYSFSLKTVEGKSVLDRGCPSIFNKKKNGQFAKFILRSALIKRKSELLPSDILTVIFTLKKGKPSGKEGACVDPFSQIDQETGVWKLQQHFREILLNGNVSDIILTVKDQEFKSHRCILAARSPVFLAMMTHETKEKNSGVVDIPDVDPNTFSVFLNYLYTGSTEKISSENVAKLYTAADKYQVDDLKESCLDFMLMNISVDSFCDFVALSLLHVEKELTDACCQYFARNELAIILTPKWLEFISKNPIASNELHIKKLKQLGD